MSTATLSDNTPLDPDDELLVAYLDGELDRKEQAELENRLLDDEKLRKRLQQLQTGWDLLDELPDPSPSLKLVESTLELVVADIVKNQPKTASTWNRIRTPVMVGAACLAGILVSLVVVSILKSRAYHRQLLDLAVVEDLDAHLYGGDLTLMRQLAADPDWSQMIAASREMGDIEIEAVPIMSATPVAQREQAIKNLPLEEVAQLNSRWERFSRLSETNRQRVRRTSEAVAQQADAEFLLQTMRSFAVWRESLPPELRDAIGSSEAQTRRDAIQQAVEFTQVSISKRSSLKLDDETIERIYFALQQVVRHRVSDGDAKTIKQLERTADRGPNVDEDFPTIVSIVFSGDIRGSGGRRPFFGRLRGSRENPDPLNLSEFDMILLVLPNNALDILDLVAGGDPIKETMTLGMWAEEAVRRKSPFKRDDSTLLERYEDLAPAERDVIDLLPPREILEVLSRESGPFPN